MAPILRQAELCFTSYNISTDGNTNSTAGTDNYNEEDKHALLYIVCTLLFYSLGIMIGIVSYIKREKQDIEQERMFDDFLTSFRGKTEAIHYRQLKVQETIERLAEIERISEESFDVLDARKLNSSRIYLREKKHLYDLANLSLIQTPVVVLTSMTSLAASNEPECDRHILDPYEDEECNVYRSETIGNKLNVKADKNIITAFTDYNRDHGKKELSNDSSEDIAESDLGDDKLETERNTAVGNNEATIMHHKLKSDSSQGNVLNHYIQTSTGKRKEKSFEVIKSLENPDSIVGEEGKQEDINFKLLETSL